MNSLCLLTSTITAFALCAVLLMRAAVKAGARELAYVPVRDRKAMKRRRSERTRSNGIEDEA
jgi:hypothetical protein